jgi:hypothetical protein
MTHAINIAKPATLGSLAGSALALRNASAISNKLLACFTASSAESLTIFLDMREFAARLEKRGTMEE